MTEKEKRRKGLTEKEMAEECMVMPGGANPRVINIRKALKYCAEKGIEPPELTEEELEKFRFYLFGAPSTTIP